MFRFRLCCTLIIMLLISYSRSTILEATAAYIASKVYKNSQTTLVAWKTRETMPILNFLLDFNGSVSVTDVNSRNANDTISYNQIVFFADEPQDVSDFMSMLCFVRPIKLILVLTKNNTDVMDLNEITRIAWKNQIANIIIVCYDESFGIKLYTYFPYTKGNCADFTPVQINLPNENYFPLKFKNFHGCPIKVSVTNYMPASVLITDDAGNVTSLKGTDGNLFNLLSERLNAKLDFTPVQTNSDAFKYFMYNQKTDVTVPALIIKAERIEAAQATHVHQFLSVVWCLPKPREINSWAKIFFPLYSDLSVYLCLTCVAFLFAGVLIARYGKHPIKYKNVLLFKAVGMFLGQVEKFITNSWLLNSLFVLWIWYCMIVRIAYQGKLLEGLHIKFMEPYLHRLEDAIKAVDQFGGSYYISAFFKGTPLEKNLHVLPVSKQLDYMDDIAQGKRFLLAIDSRIVWDYSKYLQILDEQVANTPLHFYMRPRWPPAQELSEFFIHAFESGFYVKSLRDYNKEFFRKSNVAQQERNKPLDFDTLRGCFFALIVQWFICLLVFCAELIYNKYGTNFMIKEKSNLKFIK
nr:ionotropic receptor 7d.3 [Achelura yunnanensis]